MPFWTFFSAACIVNYVGLFLVAAITAKDVTMAELFFGTLLGSFILDTMTVVAWAIASGMS
jgi:hypothetical protein